MRIGLLLTLLFVSGCVVQQEHVEELQPPTINPPAIDDPAIARTQPEALPEGARAHFPATESDRFFVSIDVTRADALGTGKVARETIEPILEAIGFPGGIQNFNAPPEQGVPMRRADLTVLMQDVVREARNNRESLGPKAFDMINVLAGNRPTDAEVDAALEMGEGMNFAQYKAGIERLEIAYPFQQVEAGIPIEHSAIIASRWEGQGVTSVFGSLVYNYSVANAVALTPEQIVDQAPAELANVPRISCYDDPERRRWLARFRGRIERRLATDNQALLSNDAKLAAYEQNARCGVVIEGPTRVLLPYGSRPDGEVILRNAYRMIVRMRYQPYSGANWDGAFQIWADAENADILKLITLVHNTFARGETWNRDPGIGTNVTTFQVDPASGGDYTLEFDDMIERIDFEDDGYNASDTSISDSSGGSSATLANFNQAPLNDQSEAICGDGSNKDYQQIHVMSDLYRYTARARALTVFTPFPLSGEFSVSVEDNFGCNAMNGGDVISFGLCNGYTESDCPDRTGVALTDRRINPAHDSTVAAHEHAHSLTPRFTNTRPSDWCGMPGCIVPVGWGALHDLADFWADHFESTNCTAGWYAKNQNGVDASLYCAQSSEGGAFPRQHVLLTPFDASDPRDHFPEHRTFGGVGYPDMQIGTAALWQVRQGMRSKCRWSGVTQFGVRWARALKRTGFFGASPPGGNDIGVYRYLEDLEEKLMDEWTTAGSPSGPPAFIHNGAHTANKVSAGFARAGVFLIPWQCLDDDAATTDATSCPGGTNGGDAVIDIDDNDPADDYPTNNEIHTEVDFVELGGAAPSFHVWTGPRYQFNGSGAATNPNPSLCNEEYQVEVSTDAAFPAAGLVQSGWQTVDRDPSTANPECYAEWTPSGAQWTNLQSGGDGTRIYYRVTTRNSGGGNERVSTEPGAGLWTGVPAPYAVITSDGRSDY